MPPPPLPRRTAATQQRKGPPPALVAAAAAAAAGHQPPQRGKGREQQSAEPLNSLPGGSPSGADPAPKELQNLNGPDQGSRDYDFSQRAPTASTESFPPPEPASAQGNGSYLQRAFSQRAASVSSPLEAPPLISSRRLDEGGGEVQEDTSGQTPWPGTDSSSFTERASLDLFIDPNHKSGGESPLGSALHALDILNSVGRAPKHTSFAAKPAGSTAHRAAPRAYPPPRKPLTGIRRLFKSPSDDSLLSCDDSPRDTRQERGHTARGSSGSSMASSRCARPAQQCLPTAGSNNIIILEIIALP